MGNINKVRISRFAKQYQNSKVEYDKRWQRRDSNWSVEKKRSFIVSLFAGETLGSICVSNVQDSLDHFKETTDTESVKYFTGLLREGKKFVSIDGQHRTKAILEFLNGEFSITASIFDRQNNCYVSLKNTFWNDIVQKHPSIKQQFLGEDVNVEEVENISLDRLPEVFKSLNDGSALSRQQKRQASHRDIAATFKRLATSKVLSLALTTEELLVKAGTVTSKQASQAAVDELFVMCAMDMIREIRDESGATIPNPYKKGHLRAKELDAFYLQGKPTHRKFDEVDCPYISEEINRFEQILAGFVLPMVVASQQSQYQTTPRVTRGLFWALAHVSEWLYDNGYEINKANARELFDYVQQLDESLKKSSRVEYAKATTEGLDVKEYDYYHRQTQLPHQPDGRVSRKKTLIAALKDKVATTSVPGLKFKQPDHADFLTELIQKSQNSADLIA